MEKIVVYQIFTRLFANPEQGNVPGGSIQQNGCGKFNRFTPKVLEEIRALGTTHVWYTGVLAHASCTSYGKAGITDCNPATVKGKAGSPYAIRDYYDVDPDLAQRVSARKTEFRQLIERTHQAGMKVVIDFVPNHVARQYSSSFKGRGTKSLGDDDDTSKRFSPDNNFYYIPNTSLGGSVNWGDYSEFPAKATGNDRFTPYPTEQDWYETVKINYGIDYEDNYSKHFDPVPDTWHKMLHILLYWAGYGIDGFRCDMAEMVPVEFWHWAISQIKIKFPDIIFIAEIYNPGAYSSYIQYGGFDYLYDKVGLYDTLRAVTERRESATAITGCWQRTGESGSHMLHFMENHDEQRLASDFFAADAFAGRAAMIVSATIDTCPVMIYAGQELGERGMDQEGFSGRDGRTTIFDYWSPDTLRRWYNNSEIGPTLLSAKERELQGFYSQLLNLCRSHNAISNGLFFDLMYVNPRSDDFDPHRQYAFLRSDGSEMLLIVANFSDKPAGCKVTIPQHAFEYLGLKPSENKTGTDLLSGQKFQTPFQPDSKIRVQVPANSGAIIEFRL